jgi:UDP-GlcNAc:undecaprenyl-phosphate GlcNAc-1-phosphate transferase
MFFFFCIILFVAFFLSVGACFVVRGLAPRLGLIDKPGAQKIHTEPIPTGGGIGIGFGILVPFAICQCILFFVLHFDFLRSLFPETIAIHFDGIWYRSGQLWILLGLGSILLILGTLDDRFNLSWKLRLSIQILVAIAAVCCGWRLTAFVDAPVLTGILSVIWIVGLTNSFNMLDNMNGLSAGIAVICGTFLVIVTMFLSPNPMSHQPQLFVAGFLLVLIGSLAGFLLYNNPFRASIFMGDGGAYFIGFLLATSTLTATFSGYQVASQTVYVPLLIFAVPIYDTTTVILIRLRNRKSFFIGDKNHFSHRLVSLGLSRTQAVLTVYLTTTICCFGSLLLYKVDFYGATLIFVQTFLVLLLIAILEHTGSRN